MGKLCECCGKSNGSFFNDPLYLEDDRILCHKCAKNISTELSELYFVNNLEEIEKATRSIIEKSKDSYNEKIINDICILINRICKKKRDFKEASNFDAFNYLKDGYSYEAAATEETPAGSAPAEAATTEETPTGSAPANTPKPSANISYDNDDMVMFSNIGKKIKFLAAVVTWIGIIASVICGIGMMTIGDEFVLVGLLVAVLGSLASWISSFILYGFGQLVDNSDKTVNLLRKLNDK